MADEIQKNTTIALDPKIAMFALNVWNYKQGEVVS